jgi:adenylate kinase family enzyme
VREEGKAQDLLLVGPPLSGCSTLAARLKATMSLPYPILRLNEVVKAVLGYKGHVAAELRRAVGEPTPSELKKLEAHMTALRERLAATKTALEAAMKAKPKGKGKGPQEPPAEQAEVERVEKEIAEATAGRGVTPELLASVLQLRLRQPDAARGCIIDGLDCEYMPREAAAEAVKAACKNLATLHLDLAQADYSARLQKMEQGASATIEAYDKQLQEQQQLLQMTEVMMEEGEEEGDETSHTANRSPPRAASRASSRSAVSSVATHKSQPPGPPAISAEAYEQAQALKASIAELLDPTSKKAAAGRAAQFFAELPVLLEKLTPPPPPEQPPQPEVPQQAAAEASEQGQEGAAEPVEAAPAPPALPSYPILVTLAQGVTQTLEESLKALLAAMPVPLVPIPGPFDLEIPKARTYMILSRPGARPMRKPAKSCFSISKPEYSRKVRTERRTLALYEHAHYDLLSGI